MIEIDTAVVQVEAVEFLPSSPDDLQRIADQVTPRLIAEGGFDLMMSRFDGFWLTRDRFMASAMAGGLIVTSLIEQAPAASSHYRPEILRLLVGRLRPDGELGELGLVTTIGRRIRGSSFDVEPIAAPPALTWAANSYLKLINAV